MEDYRFLSGSSIHTYWGSFWIFILKTVISQLDCHPNNKHDIFSNPEKRPGRDTYIFACYLVTRLIFALFFLFFSSSFLCSLVLPQSTSSELASKIIWVVTICHWQLQQALGKFSLWRQPPIAQPLVYTLYCTVL